MHRPSRPPTRLEGSAAVTEAAEGSGGVPAEAAAGSRRLSGGKRGSARPVEPDSPASWRRTLDGLAVFQSRSIFQLPRRRSSGYFSLDGDALPSPPASPWPVTADRATQTPSPSGQVMQHALQRVAEARGGSGTSRLHGLSTSDCSAQPHHAAEDMRVEEVGRELQRIGDDYNDHLLRRERARRRQGVVHPIQLMPLNQELAFVTCAVVLLVLLSRIIFSQDPLQD
ncbi:bcl-2-like protein 11 isoform X2 [Nelusetta ayraudi]|uniref:bcl-2-like protein 11 isoform X2 n=1 Tax=Nelusetta ayraudi TaxID=303726 RepID=UPI003F729B8F